MGRSVKPGKCAKNGMDLPHPSSINLPQQGITKMKPRNRRDLNRKKLIQPKYWSHLFTKSFEGRVRLPRMYGKLKWYIHAPKSIFFFPAIRRGISHEGFTSSSFIHISIDSCIDYRTFSPLASNILTFGSLLLASFQCWYTDAITLWHGVMLQMSMTFFWSPSSSHSLSHVPRYSSRG